MIRTRSLLDVADVETTSVSPDALERNTAYLGLENLARLGGITRFSTVGQADLASSKFVFTSEHVLLGKLRPLLRKVAYPGRRGVCSTDIYPLRPGPALDGGYLYHFLRTPGVGAWLSQRATGANLPRVSRSVLKDLAIPIVPLEDQRRIAALLDQVDELRAKRRRTLALLNELRESLFRSLLNAAESPYAVVKVRELVRLRSGKFLPSKAMVTRGAVPVYGGNGVNGHHNVAMYEEPRIIIGRVGAHCGSVHVTAAKSWVTDNALICDWDENVMLLGYLADALRYAKLNQYAATTDLRQISARRIGELPLVVPPMRIQELYVHNSYEVGKLLAHAEADLAKLDELFASLQHRAFTGRL